MVIKIKYIGNFSKIKIETERHIIKKIGRAFGFYVKNIEYMPTYGNWDGWTSIITDAGYAPYGALDAIINHITNNMNMSVEVDKELFPPIYNYDFLKSLKIKDTNIIIRPDQWFAVEYAIRNPRSTLIASTSFGKTLVTYYLCRYYLQYNINVCIIVPTVALVDQLVYDFRSYGYEGEIAAFKSGSDKEVKPITVSTYQTLSNYSHLLDYFQAVILDEAHKIKASTIKTMLKKSKKLMYRTGLTGTLEPESEEYMNALGILGTPIKVTTTSLLMKNNVVANLTVKILRFMYPIEKRKENLNNLSYQEELSFYESYQNRMDTIIDEAINFNKTGLIIVRRIDYADKMYKRIRERYPDRIVYQIRGNYNQRQDVMYKSFGDLKHFIEKEKNAILVVGVQVFSTGISLKNIHFGIMATQTKSYIMLLQTIGRGLRVNEVKKNFTFVDILDDLRITSEDKTYAFNHYLERLKHYEEQNFKIDKKSINLY